MHPPTDDGARITLAPADWTRLAELRATFLSAAADADPEGARPGGVPDYWRSERDLEIYDATFGARIGWKWNAVLDEMRARDIAPPNGTVVDWGAGTGVASRAFLARFGPPDRARVHLVERSPAARAFAAARLKGLRVTLEEEPIDAPDVLLVSHVINELDARALEGLLGLARRARFVVWVESGARPAARALSAARERLLDVHDPLLPCTHRAACGMLAPGMERHWCHHFARPAPEAFTTAHWRAFSRSLSIDLRALPYAYLVLRARTTDGLAHGPGDAASAAEDDRVRIVGSGRVEKGRASFDACGKDGVRAHAILERTDKAFVRALAERSEPRVLRVEEASGRVSRVLPA